MTQATYVPFALSRQVQRAMNVYFKAQLELYRLFEVHRHDKSKWSEAVKAQVTSLGARMTSAAKRISDLIGAQATESLITTWDRTVFHRDYGKDVRSRKSTAEIMASADPEIRKLYKSTEALKKKTETMLERFEKQVAKRKARQSAKVRPS